MATTVAATGTPAAGDSSFLERVTAWVNAHRQATVYTMAALVLGAGLFWWNLLSTRRSESIARDQLLQARAAFESKNYPLAASELARVAENYSGTSAAEEGTLLLAHVRLLQGQAQQAIAALKDFAPAASTNYRSQAFGLLGAAYENVGRPREAAEAYQAAVEAAGMEFLKAQFLSDAGRAYLAAGDTTRAFQAYRRIVSDFDKSGPVQEARVRIGELTRGAGSQ